MFEVSVIWNVGDNREVSYTNTEEQAWKAVSIALDEFKCVNK